MPTRQDAEAPPFPSLPLSSTLSPAQSALAGFNVLSAWTVVSASGSTPCSAGQYLTVAGTPVCPSCPAGTYVSTANLFLSCFPCPPGTFSAERASGCTACAAGFFQPNWATSACAACPAGYTSTAGNSTCGACPPGSYAAPGSAQCALCPKGYYSSHSGAAACTLCPTINGTVNTTAEAGSSSVEDCVVVVDFCANNAPLCGPNQLCVDVPHADNYTCVCEPGWTGADCLSRVVSSSSSSSGIVLLVVGVPHRDAHQHLQRVDRVVGSVVLVVDGRPRSGDVIAADIVLVVRVDHIQQFALHLTGVHVHQRQSVHLHGRLVVV